MANVDYISTGESFFAPARKFFAGVSESLVLARRFRETYRELDMLSARELGDLGIGRSDIHRIAFDSVYGDDKSEYRTR